MLIFITGYMGAGKTVFGKQLAQALNYSFLDLDQVIENKSDSAVPDYFGKYGEVKFRIREREMLLSHMQDKETVIATGGGTVCFADNMELMNEAGLTVFLNTPVEIIIKRLSEEKPGRPLLKNLDEKDLAGFVKRHLNERMVYYSKARIVVNPLEEDVNGIVAKLYSLHAAYAGTYRWAGLPSPDKDQP